MPRSKERNSALFHAGTTLILALHFLNALAWHDACPPLRDANLAMDRNRAY